MKVFVSDRYPPVRERLANGLSAIPGIEIVGAAESQLDLAGALVRFQPDVVVMSTRPGVLGELMRMPQSQPKNLRPIIIALADEPEFSKSRLLSAGADFVFHRSREFAEVFKLVKRLARRG